jgi:thiol-disulfide isomerase/thioredoxin
MIRSKTFLIKILKQMQIKHFLLLLVSVCLLLHSCKEDKSLTIKGKLIGGENSTAFLDRISLDNNTEALLSKPIAGDGSFELNMPEGVGSGLYRLRVGAQSLDFVLDGTENKIEVDADVAKFQSLEYSLKGAPAMEKFLKVVTDAKSNRIDPSVLMKMVETEEDPIVSFLIASKIFTFSHEFADLQTTAANKLKAKYPKEEWVSQFELLTKDLQKEKARIVATSLIQPNMTAPDISLPDVNGKMRSLSSLKGKVVLIDFWASWCGPCRMTNPELVKIYNKYKSQGFDVYSVSLDGFDNRTRKSLEGDKAQFTMQLDRQKERWLQAIKEDNLTWENHVSDLMKWDCAAAADYGVSSIPKTFLVAKDGSIAAVDPRYNLEEKVKEALSKS